MSDTNYVQVVVTHFEVLIPGNTMAGLHFIHALQALHRGLGDVDPPRCSEINLSNKVKIMHNKITCYCSCLHDTSVSVQV